MTANLGFVGLGAMGFGMCSNLARKSKCVVYIADQDQEKLDSFDEGLGRQSTIAELGKKAEIVFLSLPSIAEVEEVCLGEDGLLAQKEALRFVVDMSTSDVLRTRRLAEQLKKHQITLIDAPVARSRQAARDGTLLVTVGADTPDFEHVLPFLECMGTDIVQCGPVGSGQVLKILNNMVLLSTAHVLAEAGAIAQKNNIDLELLCSTLALGSADSYALDLIGINYLARNHFPKKLFPASYALKDINLAQDMAKSAGLNLKGVAATKEILETTCANGWGEHYYPVMIQSILN